ncbi:MAG: diaminopimelate decarboxylase [Verrucomicrobiota bacterium]
MHDFYLKRGKLYAEKHSIDALAKKYGTPLYIYSANTLKQHYHKLRKALDSLDIRICYAMKANSNLAVLSLLAKEGASFDIVSGGELFRVLKAGGKAKDCTFAGVGKTRQEIEYAIKKGVYCFIVESSAELDFIHHIAKKLKKKAPIAFRVNPDVDAGTHEKITTGTYKNKFGIAYNEVEGLYERAAKMKYLKMCGVQIHIGSQITTPGPFKAAIEKMIPMVKRLRDQYGIEFFDIGGGIGIVYDPALESGSDQWWQNQNEPPMTPETYANVLVPLLKPLGLKIMIEPGRFIAGNAGILVSEVVYIKRTEKKNFVIVNAAMNDLVRPSMYEAYHEIVPLKAKKGEYISSDVVGPICESGDTFCKDQLLAPLEAGDRLAFLSAGAYGFVMASNYNSRPRAAELLVDGSKVHLARKRESERDLIRGEAVL